MEPATVDPSLLTDTTTSDTTGSVGTVAGVESVVSVGAVVIGSVAVSVIIMNKHQLTHDVKNEGVIDKWRSVASQGIVSLTEIFSCI